MQVLLKGHGIHLYGIWAEEKHGKERAGKINQTQATTQNDVKALNEILLTYKKGIKMLYK